MLLGPLHRLRARSKLMVMRGAAAVRHRILAGASVRLVLPTLFVGLVGVLPLLGLVSRVIVPVVLIGIVLIISIVLIVLVVLLGGGRGLLLLLHCGASRRQEGCWPLAAPASGCPGAEAGLRGRVGSESRTCRRAGRARLGVRGGRRVRAAAAHGVLAGPRPPRPRDAGRPAGHLGGRRGGSPGPAGRAPGDRRERGVFRRTTGAAGGGGRRAGR
mmetsp:Transcript_89541/g.267082  ORF Transcript_89541/g.267082 Transcript_89541/m.267082 type:complete len:215 (-) Transcript_89541:797-1441(-)